MTRTVEVNLAELVGGRSTGVVACDTLGNLVPNMQIIINILINIAGEKDGGRARGRDSNIW